MIRFPSMARPRPRRGAVVAKVALCMPLLIGIVAIAVDAGMLLDKRRHAQATADAAAMAAATDLFKTYTNSDLSDNGLDPLNAARDHARAIAKQNGYEHGVNANVIVNILPASGPYINKKGHAEVIIEYPQQRGFSAIFGSGDLMVRARAVARGKWDPLHLGILVLDPTGAGALTLSGGAIGSVPSSPVVINSSNSQAVTINGSGPSLTAESFEVVGGVYPENTGQLTGPITTGVEPMPDPYRALQPPNPDSLATRSKLTATLVNHGGGYKTYYLEPGLYDGGLAFSGKESVVMSPGVYYMRGTETSGGFQFSGTDTSSLTAEGVMLYNDRGTNTANAQISITGQASVLWSPPTNGPYKGMSFFQARDQDMTIYIAGTGEFNVTGAFYAPDALVDVAGGGTSTIGSQFVSWRLSLRGNGTYGVPWDPGSTPNVRELKLVE